jgi:hypothetical protein
MVGRRLPYRVGVEAAFSDRVEGWLRGAGPHTLGALGDVFGDKGFAVTIMLLMSLPALPLPTGGISHVLELIALIGSLQTVLGRTTVWLPRALRDRELPSVIVERAVPFVVKRVQWFEQRSRQRLPKLFRNTWILRVLGLVISVFTVAAALSPPFSGLDTLPSLGVVIVSLAIILEDAMFLALGVVVGTAGIALIVAVGAAVTWFFNHLL